MDINHRAMEHHLPYGVIQCCLPHDTGERAPPQLQSGSLVPDLPTLMGWKAELTLV